MVWRGKAMWCGVSDEGKRAVWCGARFGAEMTKEEQEEREEREERRNEEKETIHEEQEKKVRYGR
jgi:hypothetical protein